MNEQTTTASILVVDDNPDICRLLRTRLERMGHTVVTAANGYEALAELRARPFDLVLLDIMMPEMNGYEVLAQIKADADLRHLPVIVVSALDDMESVVKCIELGAEDHLFKPIRGVLLKARITASLEKKRLRDREQAYLRAMKLEMELGQRVQADFLPGELCRLPGWELSVSFLPAREVAGDFYDTFPLPGNRVGIIIADVCNKGVSAALFMALARTLLRAYAEEADASTSPAGILAAVHRTHNYIIRYHHQHKPYMFLTLFFGVLEPETGRLTYINAGHFPPLLFDASGVRAELEPTGPAVGLMPEAAFGVAEAHLAPGDTLLAYTDGVIEARHPRRGFFGEEGLRAALQSPPPHTDALLKRLEEAVCAHTARPPDELADDDITMLALHRLE